MRDPIRIKQILPITDGFTVLSHIDDGHGKTVFEDATKEGWHYLLALVDGGEWDDDYVAIYEMDAFGCGEIDASAFRIVPKCVCPNCGLEMTASWDVNASIHPTYTCTCGFSNTQEQPKGDQSK